MDRAKEYGCFLEVNADPARLDLTDSACKMAKEIGLQVAIATDAHVDTGMSYMRFGIYQARRGWLEAKDVINCQPLERLKQLLRRK